MKVCVIIPTYNEAKAIGTVIKKVKKLGYEIIIIDDGSTDETARMAKEEGAAILHNLLNYGKGFSLRQGFQYAIDHNFDAVVVMDGDGQHDPDDLKYFLQKVEENNTEVIIGNRMGDLENMPWLRRITNRIMSWVISWLIKQHIPDTQCGFRLIKTEVLKNIKLFSCRYEIESEILIAAGKKGYRISSVPIRTIYQDESSCINPVIDTIRFLKLILRPTRQ